MLRAVRMLIHDPVRRHARTVGPTATADVMGKHWLIKGSLGGCPRLCWACGDASPKNVRGEVTDACKGHATVKTCDIIHHVCSLRDRGGAWDLSQSSIFGAKSKNRISDIQRLTDSQTFEKATLRQNSHAAQEHHDP